MKFVVKCIAIFIVLTGLLMLGNEFLLDNEMPLAGSFILYSFVSLLLTILYGWIDAVYIQKRAPGY